jgi:hypothetical protein
VLASYLNPKPKQFLEKERACITRARIRIRRSEKMLRIFNFNIKEGKIKEFQQFIKDNEATKAAYAPPAS